MNRILEQMIQAYSKRQMSSVRISKKEEKVIITGDQNSSLVAEIKEERVRVLISHGPDDPIGFLTLFDSELENMNSEEESFCVDAFDYGLELMDPTGANRVAGAIPDSRPHTTGHTGP